MMNQKAQQLVLWNLGLCLSHFALDNSLASLLALTIIEEKVSGAIAQLSYHEAVRQILSDSGAIPLLIDMLEDESD
ncbi:hypothetical protein Leryth_005093 [Lithospermum erythrorhizon]|nr:hypothetical protein Leryth_005093 [Lithospermum erythrorhizon]